MSWKPIDEAPKDGTVVWIKGGHYICEEDYSLDDYKFITLAKYDGECWRTSIDTRANNKYYPEFWKPQRSIIWL